MVADEILITYCSGKSHSISLAENGDDPVEQVSFKRNTATTVPTAVSPTATTPVKGAAVPTGIPAKAVLQQPVKAVVAPAKPAVKFKWAEPLDTP